MTVTYVPIPRRDSEERKLWRAPQNGRRFFQCRLCGSWVDSTDASQVEMHADEPSPPDRAIQCEWPQDKFL